MKSQILCVERQSGTLWTPSLFLLFRSPLASSLVQAWMLFDYFMLLPFGEGENCLHSLKLLKDEELIIGRNRMTFKDDHAHLLFISRRHVKIIWKGNNDICITTLTQTPNSVSVNDIILGCGKEVIAKQGDILCLFHEQKHFYFKLLGIQMKPESDDLPVPPAPPLHIKSTNELEKKPEEKSDKKVVSSAGNSSTNDTLVNKTECSVCLLPLAFAHAVHPCGHHFCYSCISDWSKVNTTCPSCQTTIVGMNPSHVLNDIIEGVLANFDDKSILEDWKERLAEGIAQKKEDSIDESVLPTNKAAVSASATPSHSSGNILSALGVSRKRPHSATVNAEGTADIIDLTEHSHSSSQRFRNNTRTNTDRHMIFETPARSDTIPQQCIAFHIQPDYKNINLAEVGMPFKQALDNFDTNSTGLSNACWNPNRRCKHCRHLIAVDSFVVSSVGPPCFQKLFHVQCLSSYNRGLQFMGGGALDRAITFEKVVNRGSLEASDLTQLRYNTVL